MVFSLRGGSTIRAMVIVSHWIVLLYTSVFRSVIIVIGSRGADPVWMYDSSKIFAFVGKPVSVRFDSHSLWIVRPDRKELHLRQDYSNDVFAGAACSGEVRRHWLEKFVRTPRPASVPADAVPVPLNDHSYFGSDVNLIVRTIGIDALNGMPKAKDIHVIGN
jgi:hypothetical protein